MSRNKHFMNNIVSFILRNSAKLFSPIISQWEKKLYRKYSINKPQHPIIFIIGAPRTGSTLFYQLISNSFDITYTDNLSALFYKNWIFGLKISQLIYKGRWHNSFISLFGDTKGGHEPAECGEFWYRWFPVEHHFVEDLSPEKLSEIRKNIVCAVNYFQKPLVFKNLNAGQRIRALARALPEAKFIFCRRERLYSIQSVLEARKKLNISPNEWWSIKPKNFHELLKENEIDMVTGQIVSLEEQILNDTSFYPNKNCMEVRYEYLCNNTQQTLENISDFIQLKISNNKNYDGEFNRAENWRLGEEVKDAVLNSPFWKKSE